MTKQKPSKMHLGPEAWEEALERLHRYLATEEYSNYVMCSLLLTVVERILISTDSSDEATAEILEIFMMRIQKGRSK